jgi:hypothetical protein
MARQLKRPLTEAEESHLQFLQDRCSRLERRGSPEADKAYSDLCRFARSLEQRETAPFVDVSNISEYGLTQKLSNSIRCF